MTVLMDEMDEEREEKAECQFEDCHKGPEGDSKFCIFHMPAEEKEEKKLWNKCMEQFYKGIEKLENKTDSNDNFDGYVLKDVDLAGKTIKGMMSFKGAKFHGVNIFSNSEKKTKFEKLVNFSRAIFYGGADFQKVIFMGKSDFQDVTFSHIADFSGAIFNKEANFQNATFIEYVDFMKSTFTKIVNMSDVTFQERAYFKDITFCEKVSFTESKFGGGVEFLRTIFNENVDFGDAIFDGNAIFCGVKFCDRAYFKKAIFANEANFGEATFSDEAYFRGTTFSGEANFRGVTFWGIVYFGEATFSGEANFGEATFSGEAYYSGTTFLDQAYFMEATFKEKANFRGTILSGYTNFRAATFSEQAHFMGVIFKDGGSINGCGESDGMAPKMDFTEASIQYVSFKNVILNNIAFDGAKMETSYLADAIWDETVFPHENKGILDRIIQFFSVSNQYTMIEESDASYISNNTREKEDALKIAKGTYRRIKHSLANEGEYELAGEFFIKEREMNRAIIKNRINSPPKESPEVEEEDRAKSQPGDLWNYIIQTILYYIGGYGEKPAWVMFWGWIVIVFFTFIYGTTDAFYNTIEGVTFHRSYVGMYYLYFSIVTFTTLGYGDLKPLGAIRMVAASEAIIGALLIAYFVVSWARKVMR